VTPKEINERTTPTIVVTFKDENGNPVIPGAGYYRIDDHLSETEILDETAIPGLDTSVEIVLTQEQTRILDDANEYEIRRLTVRWDYGSDRHGNAEYFLNGT
jgi:hypothetical protein